MKKKIGIVACVCLLLGSFVTPGWAQRVFQQLPPVLEQIPGAIALERVPTQLPHLPEGWIPMDADLTCEGEIASLSGETILGIEFDDNKQVIVTLGGESRPPDVAFSAGDSLLVSIFLSAQAGHNLISFQAEVCSDDGTGLLIYRHLKNIVVLDIN
jgi:hypothetical protein